MSSGMHDGGDGAVALPGVPHVPAGPDGDTEAGSIRLSSRCGRWVLAVTVLGSGVAFLEATVVNVALPTIGRDLNADVAGLQWTINGYLLTLAALILLGGSLGDRYGRRRVFTIGVVWFTVASLLCAVAPNVGVLVAARVIQGIGGALLTPGSLAIIESTFHPEDRARAIGAWSALGGISAAIGPLVGGYLVDAVTWRAIFFLNVPLGALVVYAARRHVPESRDPTVSGRLDIAGSALATFALGGITFAFIQGSEHGIGSAQVLAALFCGVASSLAFVWVERRSASPMLPLSIFKSKQFTSANVLTFVIYTALGGVFFLLVVFLQVALGYSPVEAGAASLPITAIMLVVSPRAGALAQRIGPRIPLTVGSALTSIGMLLMREIDIGDSYTAAVLPAVIVYGVGLSLVVAPITATVLAAADPRHAGVASGINNAVARTAQLTAVAVLPVVAGLSGTDYESPTALTDGFRIAMLVTAAVAAAGALLAWLTIEDDVLAERSTRVAEPRPAKPGVPAYPPVVAERLYQCGVAGTPLSAADDRERELERAPP